MIWFSRSIFNIQNHLNSSKINFQLSPSLGKNVLMTSIFETLCYIKPCLIFVSPDLFLFTKHKNVLDSFLVKRLTDFWPGQEETSILNWWKKYVDAVTLSAAMMEMFPSRTLKIHRIHNWIKSNLVNLIIFINLKPSSILPGFSSPSYYDD